MLTKQLIFNALLTTMLVTPVLVSAQTAAVNQSRTAPIMSQWEKQITPDNAWREYPRPQLVRQQWQT